MIHAIADTYFMTHRHFRNLLRQPAWILISLVQPVVWLLLYGALFRKIVEIPGFGAGSYIDFLTPGIVVMTCLFSAGLERHGPHRGHRPRRDRPLPGEPGEPQLAHRRAARAGRPRRRDPVGHHRRARPDRRGRVPGRARRASPRSRSAPCCWARASARSATPSASSRGAWRPWSPSATSSCCRSPSSQLRVHGPGAHAGVDAGRRHVQPGGVGRRQAGREGLAAEPRLGHRAHAHGATWPCSRWSARGWPRAPSACTSGPSEQPAAPAAAPGARGGGRLFRSPAARLLPARACSPARRPRGVALAHCRPTGTRGEREHLQTPP